MDIKQWLGEDNQLGIDIWNKKYKFENETFEEWLVRVSNGNEALIELIKEKKFLFGGRILSNRGLEKHGKKITFSNCYVLTTGDSIEDIYQTCSDLARTFSYGGGVGVDISPLRAKGMTVNNASKQTTGACSFMDTFSQVTATIGQNGRRGALMLSLDCTHPELIDFINIKTDLEKVTKANISVRVSNDFMKAVENDEDWTLFFETDGDRIEKVVKAKEVFELLCKNNWNFAEPGILFWDTIDNWNLLSNDDEFAYAGVNPCAEEPLPNGGSCLLGSINLSAYVKNGKFDIDTFRKDIDVIVNAMNEVLDQGLPLHPLQIQRDTVRDYRQIGIGIMGIADMLIKMGVRYDSEEAIEICEAIGFELINNSIKASALLAKEQGTYPKYNKEAILQSEFLKYNTTDEVKRLVEQYGLRNSQLLTIAPCGTISTMIGVSGGIEPIFSLSYMRKTESLHGEEVFYKVFTPIAKEYMEKHGIENEEDLPDFFVTTENLNPFMRVQMQGVWQRHIDASISSTINLPNEATVEQVEQLYLEAWKNGLKGLTIYRSGCAREGILNTGDSKPKSKEENLPLKKNIGLERHLTTGCGSLHVCAFFDEDGNLVNTYLSKGSTGGCNNYMIGLSRMIGLAARNGVDIHAIVDQLNSCGVCPSYAVRKATQGDVSPGSCCPVAVGNALLDMHKEIMGTSKEVVKETTSPKCPKCGEPAIQEGGCTICKNCGWSKCD